MLHYFNLLQKSQPNAIKHKHYCLLIVLFSLFCANVSWSAVYYVDSSRTDDTGDGRSWAYAKKTLQSAIDAAAAGGSGEVWVKAGLYNEMQNSSNGALIMKSGVTVYGGFRGDETQLAQRDIAANETIISGATARGGSTAYNVVRFDSTSNARLDGFTITGGYGLDQYSPEGQGGGIYFNGTDTTNIVENCRIADNTARCGGAIFFANSSSQAINCQMTGNHSTGGGGGGAVFSSMGSPVLLNCTISSNTAENIGAIYVADNGSMRIENCTVCNNSATGGSAGVTGSSSSATLYNCTILGNAGSGSGGGVNWSSGNLAMTSCTIGNNIVSSGAGGGVCLFTGTAAIKACRIYENTVQHGSSGGVYCDGVSLNMNDCIIEKNCALDGGIGGIYLFRFTNATLVNCVIDGNTAVSGCGIGVSYCSPVITNCTIRNNNYYGLLCSWDSSPRVTNTIFENNGNYAICEMTGDTDPVITNCLFNGHRLGDYLGEGNGTEYSGTPTVDAAGVNAMVNATGQTNSGNLDGDPKIIEVYRLDEGSMAIDRGTAVGAPSVDIVGHRRPIDILGAGVEGSSVAYDIGAYERRTSETAPIITLLSTAIDFGSQRVSAGPTSPQTITIRNDGPSPLVFTGAGYQFAGASPTDFALAAQPDTFPLAPGAMRTISIIFDPSKAGTISAQLEILTNDVDQPKASVALSGVGLPNVFVDGKRATDAGDGLSWANAKKTLQAAIDVAAAYGGGDVWIKAGTYPEAITLKSNVQVYGGFAGSETALAQRKADANTTIIDGTSAGEDGASAEHVVTIQNVTNVRLDGVTVTGGKGLTDSGGGVYCQNVDGSTEIFGCVITNNDTLSGPAGGLACISASPRITQCSISGNVKGGLLSNMSSTPIISRCRVNGNQGTGVACYSGGEVSISECAVLDNSSYGIDCHQPIIVTSCTVARNSTNFYIHAPSSIIATTVTEARFSGIDNQYGGLMKVTGCNILKNNAAGVTCQSSEPAITNCYIAENRNSYGGGGINLQSCPKGSIINCTIVNNSAASGGGVYCSSGSSPSIRNTILMNNTGYAIYEADASSDPRPGNCLFFQNPQGDYFNENTIALRGGAAINSSVTGASNNVDGDPRLLRGYQLGYGSAAIDRGAATGAPQQDIAGHPRPVDVAGVGADGTDGTYDIGVWEVQGPTGAPVISIAPDPVAFGCVTLGAAATILVDVRNEGYASLNISESSIHFAGSRPQDFALGAPMTTTTLTPGASCKLPLEFRPGILGAISARLIITTEASEQPIVEVNLSGTGLPTIFADAERPDDSGNGTSWATAKKTIQSAVDAAAAYGGGEVWVRRGRYAELRSADCNAVMMKSGVSLYGGFAGNETLRSQRDISTNPTILSSAGAGAMWARYNVVSFFQVANCRLDGFTISDGQGGGELMGVKGGGGILCVSTGEGVVIANCRITGNSTSYTGGGLYVYCGAARVEDCWIGKNYSLSGGGIATCYADVQVSSCTVVENSASVGGGAYLNGGKSVVTDCVFSNNGASNMGGGLSCFEGISTVARCRITGNKTANAGGGIHASAILTLLNCLIAQNGADSIGGGVCVNTTPTQMMNCTLLENSAPKGGAYACGGLALRFDATLVNTIIAGNRGQAVYETDDRGDPALRNCIFFNNAGGDYYDWEQKKTLTGAAALNALKNYSGGTNSGCLSGDPCLVHGYALGFGSAAIDQGTAAGAPATDIAGRGRPVDIAGYGAEKTGAEFDIGAYELQSASNPIIGVTSETVNLGSQPLGSGPTQPAAIVIRNSGFGALTFTGTGTTLSGGGAGAFHLAPQTDASAMDPGTTRLLSVSFEPTALGLTSATLTLTTNDPDTPALAITLLGYGALAAPQMKAEPAFTLGHDNTVAWEAVAGATGYTVECSTKPDFSTLNATRSVPAAELSAAFNNLAGQQYYYRVRAIDANGKSGAWSAPVSSTQDATAPSGSIRVNAGAGWTSSTMVTLTITTDDQGGSGVVEMRLSNDAISWTAWEPLAAIRPWTLSPGDGSKAVHIQLRDAVGNASPIGEISGWVQVDQTPPSGGLSINNHAAFTRTRQVTLNLNYSWEVGLKARFSEGTAQWTEWEDCYPEKSWTLTDGDGLKTVSIQYRDTLGNVSTTPIIASIWLDQTAPQAFAPSSADEYSTNSTVMFTWPAAYDPSPGSGVAGYECQIGTTPGGSDVFSGAVGKALAKAVNGPLGKTLYCRVRALDAINNVGAWSAASAGVFIDTPPAAPVVAITPAAPLTRDDIHASVRATDADVGDQVVDYRYEWRRGGMVVSTAPTLDDAQTTKGQSWTLSAWACDSYGVWSAAGQCAFTIANTPPTQPIVDIRPQPARAGQNLIVDVLDYSTDPDGDQVAYDFTWLKSTDGGQTYIHKVELDGSSQVVGDYIRDGEIWEVRYTPYEKYSAKPSVAGKPLGRVEGQYAMARAYIGANNPPALYLNTPLYHTVAGGGRQLEITWQYSEQDGETCKVDLGWTDRAGRGLQKLVADLPAQQRSFKITATLPTDRPVYVYGVIRDSKQSDSQVFSPPVLVEGFAAQRILDYLLGKSASAAELDANGDGAVNVADLLKSLKKPLPGTPTNPAPGALATGIGLRPTLDWGDCLGARSYQIYVWPATSMRPALPTAKGLVASAYMPAGDLAKGVKYNWQVVAVSDVALTNGPVWSFTTVR